MNQWTNLEEGWTAGAQRSFLRAAQFAALQAASEVEPIHLLWSLLLDEGRAGLRLAASGLERSTLHHPTVGVTPEALEQLEQIPGTVPWGRLALSIAVEAQNFARQTGGGEAGTDHLLWGLISTESPAAEFLAQHGVAWEVTEPAAHHVADEPLPALLPQELHLRVREPAAPNATDLLRILDAAANRVREGLRVVEDYVRFALNDAFLSRSLKECRHDLAAALQTLPQLPLLAARDTLGDVGTQIGTAAEYHRPSVGAVLTAAFKRSGEALRTLEEYGKILNDVLPPRVEALRYRLYTLEKAVLRSGANRERLSGLGLYLLVSEELCHHGSGPVFHAALDAGVRLFQVREKRLKDRDLVDYCRRVRQWTRERDALLIINDRPDIAVLVDADGVHVGQDELSVADARRIVGPERLVGVSTHTLEQARQAVLDGADYLGVGPTFPSGTKEFTTFPGLDFVGQVAAEISLPWFAIGGITGQNLGKVLAAGARRVAVSGAICGAERPLEEASDLLAQLQPPAAP